MDLRARDAAQRPPLDPSVRALGVVSLLNDVSSETTLRILPLFLANVLGVPTSTIGWIEGVAESVATLLRIGSGAIADRLARRKPLVVAGFALSSFTKPLLYFAASWQWVLGIRVFDRMGKAVRTPARDALIAELSPANDRGRAFGFNKAMDKAGSLAGLILAAGLIALTQSGAAVLTRRAFQAVTLLAVLPGIAAVIVLVRGVKEPGRAHAEDTDVAAPATTVRRDPAVERDAPSPAGVAHLGAAFWLYLAVLFVFSLGNSSDAFLTLRAQSVGFPVFGVFLVIAGFSAVVALTSTAAGAWSDRFGRRRVIALGWAIYAAVYFGFAIAAKPWHVAVLYAAYGLYYGAFQGVSAALVADLVPPARRGAAYGLFHAAIGVAALPASVIAGALWQRLGPATPFWFGGGLALVAAAALACIPMPAGAGGSGSDRVLERA